ncbi:E3 ubiquitin-protein ligase TRIM11-like [Pleurodeles waltl]|uniref:E3 ubiquitin-protein ligase TRIM11-like n=1 Tax=Pleurodeles waltl TaxID=8319 RepID=UPI0037098E7C
MAAAAQLGSLKEEATCSICLEYFTDPVMIIDCGHNFCRSCITQSWEGGDGNFPCPQCRGISPGKNLRPNRQLGNMVEMLKQLHLPPVKPPEESLCEKHEEKLRLFCAEDQRMICWVCRESKEHKTHSASPVEEAAEEYKVKLQEWLHHLKKEEEYKLKSKVKEEEQYKAIRDKLRTEKQKIESELEKLQQLLKENEKALHRRLEEMEKQITMVENANITKLSNQITSLKALITEIEKKCQTPAWELLKDVGSTLSRCDNVKIQCPEVVAMRFKVMVTLDPDTAHPQLLLSEWGRRVSDTDTWQPLLDTPKRFTYYHCVLGSEGFTSGRHYWEVQLLNVCGGWNFGVAAETVNRTERMRMAPDGGVWAVRGCICDYTALTYPRTPLSPRENPLKLGVYLDYEGGRLSLYNAHSMELLYTFPRAPFTQRLFPFFRLWEGAEVSVRAAESFSPSSSPPLVTEALPYFYLYWGGVELRLV